MNDKKNKQGDNREDENELKNKDHQHDYKTPVAKKGQTPDALKRDPSGPDTKRPVMNDKFTDYTIVNDKVNHRVVDGEEGEGTTGDISNEKKTPLELPGRKQKDPDETPGLHRHVGTHPENRQDQTKTKNNKD
jgi:hypothetical protein